MSTSEVGGNPTAPASMKRYAGVMTLVALAATFVGALGISIMDAGQVGIGTLLFLPYALLLVAVFVVPAALVGTLLGLTTIRIMRDKPRSTRLWSTSALSALGFVGGIATLQLPSDLIAIGKGCPSTDSTLVIAGYVGALIVMTVVFMALNRSSV